MPRCSDRKPHFTWTTAGRVVHLTSHLAGTEQFAEGFADGVRGQMVAKQPKDVALRHAVCVLPQRLQDQVGLSITQHVAEDVACLSLAVLPHRQPGLEMHHIDRLGLIEQGVDQR